MVFCLTHGIVTTSLICSGIQKCRFVFWWRTLLNLQQVIFFGHLGVETTCWHIAFRVDGELVNKHNLHIQQLQNIQTQSCVFGFSWGKYLVLQLLIGYATMVTYCGCILFCKAGSVQWVFRAMEVLSIQLGS